MLFDESDELFDVMLRDISSFDRILAHLTRANPPVPVPYLLLFGENFLDLLTFD